jgi:hypothetical protein
MCGDNGGERWNRPGDNGGEPIGDLVRDRNGGGCISDRTVDMVVSKGESMFCSRCVWLPSVRYFRTCVSLR